MSKRKTQTLKQIGWAVCIVVEGSVILTVQGIFDNEKAACKFAEKNHIKATAILNSGIVGLGPVELTTVIPDKIVWPGFYYPDPTEKECKLLKQKLFHKVRSGKLRSE